MTLYTIYEMPENTSEVEMKNQHSCQDINQASGQQKKTPMYSFKKKDESLNVKDEELDPLRVYKNTLMFQKLRKLIIKKNENLESSETTGEPKSPSFTKEPTTPLSKTSEENEEKSITLSDDVPIQSMEEKIDDSNSKSITRTPKKSFQKSKFSSSKTITSKPRFESSKSIEDKQEKNVDSIKSKVIEKESTPKSPKSVENLSLDDFLFCKNPGVKKSKCFNCRSPEHIYTKCPEPKIGNFCKGCGWENVIKPKCPSCKGKTNPKKLTSDGVK